MDKQGDGRRQTPQGVIAARAATAILDPVHGRIAEWQVEASLLAGLRDSRHPHIARAAARRTTELAVQVEAELALLLAELANQPLTVQTHSRTMDTKRALDSLLRSLRAPEVK